MQNKTRSKLPRRMRLSSLLPAGIELLVPVLVLALLAGAAHAGEDTKPVSLTCPGRAVSKSQVADSEGYGYSLIREASKGKRMDMERSEAFGEMDMLLTSSYGLRQPLATITNKRAADQVALASQLAFSGYVISAQMLYGVIKREALLPVRTLALTGNLLFTMIEPDDEDPSLVAIAKKVRDGDLATASIDKKSLPFARWLIRAYAYNDPVAVDAALRGYCDTLPSQRDTKILEQAARKSRLDPRTITVAKEQRK